MKEIQNRLLENYPQYRKIWVQYAHFQGRFRILITLFPHGHGTYRMVRGEVQELTYELISDVLLKNI